MNLIGVAAAVAGVAGVALVAGAGRSPRADPIARAIGVAGPGDRGPGLIDRCLAQFDVRFGAQQRSDSLRLTGQSPGAFRRVRLLMIAAALTAAVAMTMRHGFALSGAVVVTGAVPTGLLAADLWLQRGARAVRERLREQVPVASEIVALSVTAGEAPGDALARAASASTRPLQPFLAAIASQVRDGRSLDQALAEVANLVDVPEFHRLADTVSAASSRGLPLASTLLEQVKDMRATHHAHVLERAGRREIAMLVPVVFVILPCVVVVAVFPGAVQILSLTS